MRFIWCLVVVVVALLAYDVRPISVDGVCFKLDRGAFRAIACTSSDDPANAFLRRAM